MGINCIYGPNVPIRTILPYYVEVVSKLQQLLVKNTKIPGSLSHHFCSFKPGQQTDYPVVITEVLRSAREFKLQDIFSTSYFFKNKTFSTSYQ